RAQQAAMPVIGLLNGGSAEPLQSLVAAFRHGLSESGYVEGQNLAIEYRWAEGDYEKLPRLVAVGRSPRKCDTCQRPSSGGGRQGGNSHDTYCIHERWQSDRAWFRVQSQPPRWKCDWSELFDQRARWKAVGVAA